MIADLNAQMGPRCTPAIVQTDITITNGGFDTAPDVQIDSIDPITVISGTGAVAVTTSMPVLFGTIDPGNESTKTLNFLWPAIGTNVVAYLIKF